MTEAVTEVVRERLARIRVLSVLGVGERALAQQCPNGDR